MLNSADLNTKINQEISRSFRNVNYSQWERQSKQPAQASIIKKQERQSVSSLALVRGRPTSTNLAGGDALTRNLDLEKKSFSNPRPGGLGKITFKSRKQQIEEEARRNLLKTKIKYTRQNIISLKERAAELTDMNLDIIEYIDKTEKTANDSVDKILRKYERYQMVLSTINKKHTEEVDFKQRDISSIKKEASEQLPKYEKASTNVETDLRLAQNLNEQLSIYKNQEYPEKVLKINNLRKNLNDLREFQQAEKESFMQMMEEDRERDRTKQFNLTEDIANKVTEEVVDEMHFSLKEMAVDNQIMNDEIKFFKNLLFDLKDEIKLLEREVDLLRKDRVKANKTAIFSDVLLEKKICTPDMDVCLDLGANELY